MPDLSTVFELAARHGVQAELVEKVLRMLELLDSMGAHPHLAGRLALKGGTALNLGYGPPRRLSVDLDLNYVGSTDRDAMLAERPEVERAIEAVAGGLRYSVQAGTREHAGRTWYLGYTNIVGRRDRVEVDVSYTNRVPLMPLQTRPLWTPLSHASRPVLMCSPEELVAGKLRALLDRVAARDVFDATWMTSLVPVENAQLFRRLFVLIAGTLPRPLTEYGLSRLDGLTQRDVDTYVRPLALGPFEYDRSALVVAASRAVAPLLMLDEAEAAFTARLNAGEFRPDIILREWPDTLDRLREHPALIWKAQNAARRSR